jgi:hypothetical protein
MTKDFTTVVLAGIAVLAASLIALYGSLFLFPTMMEEYYSEVFRDSSFNATWLFYVHPFLLSAGLKWVWERGKDSFEGPMLARAVRVGLVYTAVAIVPVLWLTFSAMNISLILVFTWVIYGMLQSMVACVVFSMRS